MSEIAVTTPDRTNQEIYDRLLVSIEAGLGLLQIFIAVCDADRQREQIITNYERELSSYLHTYRVNLDLTEPSLRRAIASVLTSSEKAIVTVSGAEILGLSSPDELDKFFGYLQWTRESRSRSVGFAESILTRRKQLCHPQPRRQSTGDYHPGGI